jgi:hypothetical protein
MRTTEWKRKACASLAKEFEANVKTTRFVDRR